VAIDLSKGTIAWRVTFGDMPNLRKDLEALGVTVAPKIGAQGPAGAIVTSGGAIFIGGGDFAFHAVDKSTGARFVEHAAARNHGHAHDLHDTFRPEVVVVATGRRADSALVAFALPAAPTTASQNRD
jgi:glucose dehydrogenase